jgi:hypothetical protein
MVDQRGAVLRAQPFEELMRRSESHSGESVTVESRSASIVTMIDTMPDGSIRVVLRGTLEPKFIPIGYSVAMDGFYKHPDQRVVAMTERELHEFD